MKAPRKSMVNVTGVSKKGITKLGRNQRRLMVVFHQYPRFEWTVDELAKKTDLAKVQVSQALQPLVKVGLLVSFWSKDGQAVYRLKGK